MSTPYLSEIRLVSFNFAPKGWALCNGQTLSISQNVALFSLIGTYYGGDGVSTFQLPNLQGASPIHVGTGYAQGQTAGEVNHTLLAGEMPAHTHQASGVSTTANLTAASGNASAVSSANQYAASPNTTMSANSDTQVGGNQPHPNQPPYLVMNYIIALTGIFPTRN